MTPFEDETPRDDGTLFEDGVPHVDEAPVEDKTPLLETHPCNICSCSDFESKSPGDDVCRCGHKESDHKDFEWTTT